MTVRRQLGDPPRSREEAALDLAYDALIELVVAVEVEGLWLSGMPEGARRNAAMRKAWVAIRDIKTLRKGG
jgi:hypothetical protein